MDDFGMQFFSFVFAVIAFFLALRLRGQVARVSGQNRELRDRLTGLELRLSALENRGPPAPDEATAPAADAPAANVPRDLDVPEPATLVPADQPAPVREPPVAGAWQSVKPGRRAPQQVAPEKVAGRGLEETLGARWTVWVGGLALALGAVLLVRYSIEQGFFGPGLRLTMAGLFGLAMLATGEWMRRRDPAADLPVAVRGVYIPGMLTAVGTLAIFATIYAAHALYGFIGPAPAFLLLGATGVAAMAASALHGPALAGLGLAGSLVSPLLINSDQHNPWPVVIYIAVVAGAAFGLSRLRSWLWLALATVAGGAIWALAILMIDAPDVIVFQAALVNTIIQSALAALAVAVLPHRGEADETARFDPAAHLVLVAWTLLGVVILAAGLDSGSFGTAWWIGAVVLTGIPALAGWLAGSASGGMALSAVMALATIRIWPAARVSSDAATTADYVLSWVAPVEPATFGLFTVAMFTALALAGGARALRGGAMPHFALACYALTAAIAPLAALGIVYLRFAHGEVSGPLAIAAALVAVAFVAGAKLFLDRRAAGREAMDLAGGAFAAAAIAALCLGLVFVLSGGTLTVAMALGACATAFVSVRLDLVVLRWCVAALAGVIGARFAWEPRIVGLALSATPVFNWLLFGYGVPALAFGISAQLLRRRRDDDIPVRVADAVTILFSALLVVFEIRHALNNGDPFAHQSGFVEQGLIVACAALFSIVLMALDQWRANIVYRLASLMAGGVGLAVAAFGLVAFVNPALTDAEIAGNALFNTLLVGYALPAALAGLAAQRGRALGRHIYATCASAIAIILAFAFVTLEVRRVFQGPRIGVFLRSTSDGESYSYSVVWLALGIALLAWGLWRGSREARIASAGLIVLTCVKVFLFDLANLEGILRALSFMGLGGVLIGVGLVYQKLVFAKPANPPAS